MAGGGVTETPALERSRWFRMARTSSGERLPLPTSMRVPARMRHILYLASLLRVRMCECVCESECVFV